MNPFLPLWTHRLPHFGYIPLGEGAWGGSDIRSMSSIRPICKCECWVLSPVGDIPITLQDYVSDQIQNYKIVRPPQTKTQEGRGLQADATKSLYKFNFLRLGHFVLFISYWSMTRPRYTKYIKCKFVYQTKTQEQRGPWTDKHLPKSPYTINFFRWRHFALVSIQLISPCIEVAQ